MTGTAPSRVSSDDHVVRKRLAWVLGFALPFSAGFAVSQWIPGYPPQLTVIRIVSVFALSWIVFFGTVKRVPPASRKMIGALAIGLAYASLSLLWTKDLAQGFDGLLNLAFAAAAAMALLLLVQNDQRVFRAFALGVLSAALVQTIVAVFEVRTGLHPIDSEWATLRVQTVALPISIEEKVGGSVAWGTWTNPNDLGGFLLLSTCIFLSRGSYGVTLTRGQRLLGFLVLGASAWVGLTSLVDARAYRLGLLLVFTMHLVDRMSPPAAILARRLAVLCVVGMCAVLLVFVEGAWRPGWLDDPGNALRLELFREGLHAGFSSGGFGLGIGTEQALIATGQLPVNYHNVIAQLAAELGIVLSAAFATYLISIIFVWAFRMGNAARRCHRMALARSSTAASLLLYGATASGVLYSATYWVFFASTVAILSVAPRATAGAQTRTGSISAEESGG